MVEVEAQHRLSALPGVADVEALLIKVRSNRNYKWTPEWDEAVRLVDKIGRRCLGVTLAETRWTPACRKLGWSTEDDWEDEFHAWIPNASGTVQTAAKYELSELGWDVSNDVGGELLCAELFYRLLVCVAKGMAGHEPGAELSEEARKVEAEKWAADLVSSWERGE